MATPPFLDDPPPFCLSLPFLAKILRPPPPFASILKKSNLPPLYEGGGKGGGVVRTMKNVKNYWKTSSKSSTFIYFSFLLFIFVIKSFSHCPKGLPPLLYLIGWLSVSLFHSAYVSFLACIGCKETMSYQWFCQYWKCSLNPIIVAYDSGCNSCFEYRIANVNPFRTPCPYLIIQRLVDILRFSM